jgi:hypothetical protein
MALYAVSVRRLIALRLRLPSDGPSRFRPCLRLVLVSMYKPLTGFTYRGLSPHKFTPVPGVHNPIHRTRVPRAGDRHVSDKERAMGLLEEALKSPQSIISVIGEHAGEGVDAIFLRKAADIERTTKTFWLMKSPKARPAQVQALCKKMPTYTIFVEPATKGGVRPTAREDAAREYSADGRVWHQLPEGIGPVTGKIDTSAAALVFDMMTTTVNGTLDLWDYGDFSETQKPLKFILGCSTVCAIRKDMTPHPERMKSRYRGIVAMARLVEPYCVWLR